MYSIIMNNQKEFFCNFDIVAAQDACKPDEYKFQHEIHRMMGLLRFTPDENGEFTARCGPDYYILPNLAEYFSARFGDTPWSIIDEKRGLILRRVPGEDAKITSIYVNSPECKNENGTDNKPAEKSDEWEDLWKHYHKTINNEDRSNPGLQRQFMPKRYWKYLPEKENN